MEISGWGYAYNTSGANNVMMGVQLYHSIELFYEAVLDDKTWLQTDCIFKLTKTGQFEHLTMLFSFLE